MNPKEPVKAIVHSDALVILAEWPEFRGLDYRRVKDLLASPNLIDGRNLLDPKRMKELGFNYRGVGRC